MKYAVLGTGMVGHTLATKLIDLGHDVRMGARTAQNEKAAAWAAAQGDRAGHGAYGAVADWADRVIVAINGAHVAALGAAIPGTAVAGKTVIDVTNPLDFSHGMPPVLIPSLSNTTSAGEALQAALPGARVVKTLNTMNHALMVDPSRVQGQHDVFLCGDDADAKDDVRDLLAAFGWQAPIDLGPLAAARGTEGMMPFWLRLWAVKGDATFNYAIMRG